MNLIPKLLLLCPVPEDQKPMKEYLVIRENPFFAWYLERDYFRQFRFFFCFSFLLFFSFYFFFNEKNFSVAAFLFQSFFIFFVLLCLSLFRWHGIEIRFNQARLIYEEASWYDGQVWEKPFFVIKNDRFLKSQKILAIQRRIQTTFSLFFLFFFFFIYFELLVA